jgi:hypothetical protein
MTLKTYKLDLELHFYQLYNSSYNYIRFAGRYAIPGYGNVRPKS